MADFILDNGLEENIDLLYMLLDNIALLPKDKRSSALDYFVPKKKFFGGMYSPLLNMLDEKNEKEVEVAVEKLVYQFANSLRIYLEKPDKWIGELVKNKASVSYQTYLLVWEELMTLFAH